jgi:hypothetical protein
MIAAKLILENVVGGTTKTQRHEGETFLMESNLNACCVAQQREQVLVPLLRVFVSSWFKRPIQGDGN